MNAASGPVTARRKKTERRTQAERTADAHRRMIRAAISLIARQGYTQTTLAQVGKEAGYSSGLVSHHFGSKPGLLRALVQQIAVRFYEDQVRPATVESGLEALDAMIDTYLAELELRPERMRALYVLMGEALGPLSEINEVFAELNRNWRNFVREWIEAGKTAGEIRSDVAAEVEAVAYIALLRGVANQWMAEPGCFDLEAVRHSLKHAVRRHLAA
jgi:AcrR family transcriptional regulator